MDLRSGRRCCWNGKIPVDPKLGDGVYDAGEIVADHFAKDFVDLGRLRLRPDRVAEFRLDHPHRRLDVAPPMITLQEIFAAEREVHPHLAPVR